MGPIIVVAWVGVVAIGGSKRNPRLI